MQYPENPFSLAPAGLISPEFFPPSEDYAQSAHGPSLRANNSGYEQDNVISLDPSDRRILNLRARSLSDDRQVTPPACGEENHRTTTITASTPAVTQNNVEGSRFVGDHRYPARPPLRGISQPNQSLSLKQALANWSTPINHAPCDPAVVKNALEAIRNIVTAPTGAAGPLSARQLQPPEQLDLNAAGWDPQLFLDPEHQVHDDQFICEQARPGEPQRGRLLTKREAQRMLTKGALAGRPEAVTPAPQVSVMNWKNDKRDAAGALPRAPADKITALQPNAPGTVVVPPRRGHTQVVTETPRDIKYLDFVLDGRMSPDPVNVEIWVNNTILRLISQVGPLHLHCSLRLQAIGYCSLPAVRRPMLRISDTLDGRPYSGNVGEEAQAGGPCGIRIQVSTEHVPPLDVEWPALVREETDARHKQAGGAATEILQPGAAASSQLTCLADHDGEVGEITTALRQVEEITAVRARSSRRGRRGGGGKNVSPGRRQEVVGEGGTGIGHGVRQLRQEEPVSAMEPSTSAEHGSSTSGGRSGMLPVEEDTATALAGNRGSRVQVSELDAAGLRLHKVPGQKMRDLPVQALPGESSEEGEGRAECCRMALSLRREFKHRRRGRASAAFLKGTLRVSSSRGQKGRKVVRGEATEEGTLSGMARPHTVGLRHPVPGTLAVAGAAAELALMGPPGTLLKRLRTVDKGEDNLGGGGCLGSVGGYEGTSSCAGTGRTSDENESPPVGGRNRAEGLYTRLQTCSSPLSSAVLSVAGTEKGCLPASAGEGPRGPRREARRARMTGTSGGPGVSLGDATDLSVLGDGVDRARKGEGPLTRVERETDQAEQISEPDTIEAWWSENGARLLIELRREDWETIQDLGMGAHPDVVSVMAWRRCNGARGTQGNVLAHLVLQESLDVPRSSWPNSWAGLVEHVRTGGYFRRVSVLRGGMDPSEMQKLLDTTVFDESLPWEVIDRHVNRIRSGEPIPQEELQTWPARLAQALASLLALQQWDALAAFWQTQPPEVIAGSVLSPARLLALSAITQRPKPATAPPPPWLLSDAYAEVRFNHLSPGDFVPEPHRANNLRTQIEDGIVNRILSVAPDIVHHSHYRLQDLREDLKVDINLKDQQLATCLFSASVVMPNGPWVSGFYTGALSLGGRSYCTIVPTGLYIETEMSKTDQQVLRAIRTALGADTAIFRALLDEALGKAFNCDVRSRETTVRFTSDSRGGKRTKEHVSPDSPESNVLLAMDGTGLIIARRTLNRLSLRLGPVTIGLTLPQCPHQALKNALGLSPGKPAAVRLRPPGSMVVSPVLLIGPLPKGALSEHVVTCGRTMANLRHQMHTVCQAEVQTRDVRLVGRYDKGRSPMFLYMEWASTQEAQRFGSLVDRQVPQGFWQLMVTLCGDKADQMQIWCSDLPAEALACADEKTLRSLMVHGQSHACPLPPPLSPPPPPPPSQAHGSGDASDGTGAAASGPDNPYNGRH